MNKSVLLAAAALALTACASTAPTATDSSVPAASAAADLPPATSDVEEPGSSNGDIQVLNIEGQEKVALPTDEPEIVCRRERRTGSHRAIRVCRSKAEIERTAREGKDAFEELNRSQTQVDNSNL